MTIKVLINGAFGRMGQVSIRTLTANPAFEVVGQAAREYDLKKSIQDSGAQVVVDFTHPDVVYENTKTIIAAGSHPVIGTSGLTAPQVKELQALAQKTKLGGIIAPNFSLGAVLMLKYAQAIAKYMNHVEVIEMHHENKIDSPSGTAIRTAEVLAETIKTRNPKQNKSSRETLKGARGANYEGVHIHSLRLPGTLAYQQIVFGNTGETLSLTHNTIDRECFMPGLCLACERVLTLDRLVYGLDEIL